MEGHTEIWLKETSSCDDAFIMPGGRGPILERPLEEPVCLKLLRGKSLWGAEGGASWSHPRRLWIGVETSTGLKDIASVQLFDKDPIFGGPLHTFELYAGEDDLLVVWLEGKEKITAHISELLNKLNPWLTLGGTGDDAAPRIQLRIKPAPLQAELHPQETCLTLTSGPALPVDKSYIIRKKILYSCGTPVLLNVYDVSNSPNVAQANLFLKGVGAGGIFHAGIEIFGKEYSFGGTRDRNYKGTGIFSNKPKQCAMHHYRETVYLGDCELSQHEVLGILKSLESQWLARSYNLFRKNCCFFSRELAHQLGVGDLPAWVYQLAESTEYLEPTLIRVNQYLIERRRAAAAAAAANTATDAPQQQSSAPSQPTKQDTKVRKEKQNKAKAATTNKKTTAAKKQSQLPAEATTETKTTEEPTSTIQEDPENDDDVHEVMLDHAMAARIQRSFRSKKSNLSMRLRS